MSSMEQWENQMLKKNKDLFHIFQKHSDDS